MLSALIFVYVTNLPADCFLNKDRRDVDCIRRDKAFYLRLIVPMHIIVNSTAAHDTRDIAQR